MKKFLISTALLATSVAVIAPATSQAATIDSETKNSKVTIKFKDDVIKPENGIGNIVLGFVPASVDFTGNGAGLTATTGNLSGVQADNFDKDRWLVVNDDRPENEMTGWAVAGQMSPLKEVGGTAVLNSNLTFKVKGKIKQYMATQNGETVTNGGQLDYPFPNPDESTATKDYDDVAGAVKLENANSVVFTGGSTAATTIMKKETAGKDAKNDGESGVTKGGQGYLTTLTEPTLNITSPQTKGKSYEATLTWTLATLP